MNIIEKFFAFLSSSDAVTIDDGAILTDWEESSITGEPENEVVCLVWTDGENDFSCKLTEGGIAKGMFDSNGKFVCEDHEGELVAVRFFELEQIADCNAGKKAARRFMDELLDSVETLTGIADVHGVRTLADAMYLYSAILSGKYIDHEPGESAILELVQMLPSGDIWKGFIKMAGEEDPQLSPTTGVTEILQHRILWKLRRQGDKTAPDALDDCSIEYIEKCIQDGYREGELCVTNADTEFRGWWSISNE